MTQQKTHKARVRARMARTGERYTTARAHLLRKDEAARGDRAPTLADGADGADGSDGTSPSGGMATPAPEPVPDSPFRGAYGASDEALVKRTGHEWAHWYRVLDAWGAKDRPHGEIARYLHEDMGVEGWWSQELTVRYEMAIGRRVPNQRGDGFEATGSKTVKAPPERVYAALVDPVERARWVDRPMRIRKANQNRTASAFATVRFDWDVEGERVVIWLADKGDRTAVSLAHQRLPDRASADAMKAFWRERLGALAAHVEGGG